MLACLLLCACHRTPPAPVRVGLVTYGDAGLNGSPTNNAILLAVDAANRSGGLLCGGQRRPLEIERAIIEEGSPEGAVAAVEKLINQGKVCAILGPQNSAEAVPAGGVADRSGIPLISPLSSNAQTTRDRPFVFRTCSTDAVQGALLARFAREQLHARSAALLVEVRIATSRNVADAFRATFTALGGRIVADQGFTQVSEDLGGKLRAIKEARADVLLLPNYYDTARANGIAARRAGIRSVLLGADSWSRRHLREIPEFNGAYMVSSWSPDLQSAENARFMADYARRFQAEPNETAALTFDAAIMLFAAIAASGDASPAAIRKALYAPAGFRGTSGVTRYAVNGDPDKPSVILQFRDGQVVLARLVTPEAAR